MKGEVAGEGAGEGTGVPGHTGSQHGVRYRVTVIGGQWPAAPG